MATKKLREQRGEIVTQMKSMVQETGGKMSAEQRATFGKMDTDQESLRSQIEVLDRADSLQAELALRADQAGAVNHQAKRTGGITSEDRHLAMQGWALHGSDAVTQRHRDAGTKCGVDITASRWNLKFNADPNYVTRATTAAQAAGTTGLGAEGVDSEVVAEVERQLKAFGGMREVSNVIRTADGGTLSVPTNDDTANVAAIIAESSDVDVSGLQFKEKQLGAFKYSSKFVKASIEFLQDVVFNAPAYIGESLGIRVARGTNAHFTVGTGSGQPRGVILDAIAGVSATASSLAFTYANLVALYHSVDPAYRNNANWMLHDVSLRKIKQLVDGDSRPLWSAGLASAEPDTILGKPYVINQDVNTGTTGSQIFNAVMSFGDHSKYWIRDVMDVQLVRVNERFIERGQVAWLTFSRHDGNTVAASTANWPIQTLNIST